VRINSLWLELQVKRSARTLIQSKSKFLQVKQSLSKAVIVSAAIVQWLQTRKRPKKQRVKVFAASIADINKDLAIKQITDVQTKLPD
jgi:hypothetical protein